MKALVLCDGLPPGEALFMKNLEQVHLFLAADGGGNIARRFGILPDVVIGDLDSFREKEDDPFEIIENPDQGTNDLEKALSLALERGVTDVVVLGATGRRLDQTLKNLSVLKQFNHQFNRILFKDDYGETFLIPEEYSLHLPAGTIVSLFPLSGRVEGVSTQGLKYPLKNQTLENGIRDGSSNRVVSSPIEIRHGSGDLILYILRNESNG